MDVKWDNKKVRIKEAIVVEGKYDKITLSNVFDTIIIPVHGFSLFKDKDNLELIKTVAAKTGIVVFTDSDGSGLVIRNYISSVLPKSLVKHAYIPQIVGKERRKVDSSKEGFLGVEGMTPEILLRAVINSGAIVEDMTYTQNNKNEINTMDLLELGLTGKSDSDKKRSQILENLNLPKKMTSKRLKDTINTIMTKEEFYSFVSNLNKY